MTIFHQDDIRCLLKWWWYESGPALSVPQLPCAICRTHARNLKRLTIIKNKILRWALQALATISSAHLGPPSLGYSAYWVGAGAQRDSTYCRLRTNKPWMTIHFCISSCGSRTLHVHVRASLVILSNQSTFEVNSDPFTAATIAALQGAAPSSEFRDAASFKLFNVRHSRPPRRPQGQTAVFMLHAL